MSLSAKARTVLYTVLIVVGARSALRWKRRKSFNISADDISISLFPFTLSSLYKYSSNSRLISSSSLLLLPSSWRIQLALYALTSVFIHSVRASKSPLKKYFPPIISLAFFGNSYLQWAYFFYPHGVPNSYANLVYYHSKTINQTNLSYNNLRETVLSSSFSKLPTPDTKKPEYGLCQRIHPNEQSCLKVFCNSIFIESFRAAQWLAPIHALALCLSPKGRATLRTHPLNAFKGWLRVTIGDIGSVVGALSTAWGTLCLSQRILPPSFPLTIRLNISALLGSFWTYSVNPARRDEVSLYIFRMALSGLWNLWKDGMEPPPTPRDPTDTDSEKVEEGEKQKRNQIRKGSGLPTIPYGEFIIFALSWKYLSYLRNIAATRDSKIHISGVIESFLNFVEGPVGLAASAK